MIPPALRAAARLLIGSLALGNFAPAATTPDVLVIADVTPAGKARPPASPEHPVYYEPVWAGFQELGAVVVGERPPSREKAQQELTAALTKLGYLAASAQTPPPTVLIFFAWGTLNPDVMTTPGVGVDGADEQVNFNRAQMLGFLGAHKVGKLSDFSTDKERVLTAANEDQYFLAVAAYDRASVLQRKRTLLWMTRLAADSRRVWLPETLPALIASGSRFFGRESDLPVWLDPADNYKTEVRLGEMKVEEYLPKGATRSPPAKDQR
jgi:hypothetical protein